MTGGGRFVLDTNVVVSALLLTRSTSREAFEWALEKGKILVSLPVLAELENVLSRGKFEKYLYEQERKEFMAALVREAEFIDVSERITECRDPKDDKFLELALCGGADCLISGDLDLLALHPFRKIPILPPAEFLKQF